MSIPDRSALGGTAHARAWARLGHPVFPITTGVDKDGKWAKAPALKSPAHGGPVPPDKIDGLDRAKGGFHQASIDDHFVHTTWADLRGTALAGSPLPPDVIALDFDRPEKEWLAAHPDLRDIYEQQRAATFVVETQPGRYHVYFRVPPGVRVPARFPGHGHRPDDNFRAYGEVKGAWSTDSKKAGYIVLAGQTRPDGKGAYTPLHGDPTTLALMDPRLLAHLLDGTPAAAQAPTGRASVSLKPSSFVDTTDDWRLTEVVHEGGREPALHALAWSRDWRSYEELFLLFTGVNHSLFRPPHDDAYIQTIATREWESYQARVAQRETENETESESNTESEAKAKDEADTDTNNNSSSSGSGDDGRDGITAAALRSILGPLSVGMRWNKRAARHEIRRGDGPWEGLTERSSSILAERVAETAQLDRHGRKEQWRVPPGIWRLLLHRLTDDNPVDPFADWLDGLPAWDGQERLRDVVNRVLRPVDAPDCLWHWAPASRRLSRPCAGPGRPVSHSRTWSSTSACARMR